MFTYSIFFLLLATVFCDQKSYDGWSLNMIFSQTETQLEYLNSLHENNNDLEFQIWKPGNLNQPFHILLSPEARRALLPKLDNVGIEYETAVQNIQGAIDAEKVPTSRHPRSVNPTDVDWFSSYLTLDQINTALEKLAQDNPDIVSLESIGNTHENRSITLVKISSNNKPGKPAIWIDGGIHAREWITPATVLYMLNQLISNYKTNSTIKNYVDNVTWYMVPVLNPDGYVYTRKNRMWRKNRRPNTGDVKCVAKLLKGCNEFGDSNGIGVDLNRNFDYAFGNGSHPAPCCNTYHGPYAFSEPESIAVRDFVTTHKDIVAFITIHAYSQKLFYPFSDRKNSYPMDVKELNATAEKVVKAMESVHGKKYEFGSAADVMGYDAGGVSTDWAKNKANIKYTFGFELRPAQKKSKRFNGFILPTSEIVPVGEETWAGIKVMADSVIKRKK